MSALAKAARRLLRELEFETYHRALTEEELRDLQVIERMAGHLYQGEVDCRRERAAIKGEAA